MQIVLNHVTRMRAPRICIAGIDPRTRLHVRPTTPMSAPLTRELLAVERGFVEVGALVDIGDAQPEPVKPEVEDHRCSLDAIRAAGLEVDGYGKVAVRLTDCEPEAYVKVTDVRFVEPDHKTAVHARIDDVNARLADGVQTFLMVGLSRPFPAAGNLHWLQVNGVCLADRPLGELP